MEGNQMGSIYFFLQNPAIKTEMLEKDSFSDFGK